MLEFIQRIFRHRWIDSKAVQRAMPEPVRQRLQAHVAASEKRHTGEIRMYVEAGLPLSYLRSRAPMRRIVRQRALSMFGKLRVWDTEHNNGVLIYLLLAERSIELVADRGLVRYVQPQAWADIALRMREPFSQGRFEDGLALAVDEVTALLAQHFPLGSAEERPNELPDPPVIG